MLPLKELERLAQAEYELKLKAEKRARNPFIKAWDKTKTLFAKKKADKQSDEETKTENPEEKPADEPKNGD